MPRGFVFALYTGDTGLIQYLKQVDADQAVDPARGWAIYGGGAANLWPARAKPRMVFGVSPTTGRRGHTIVAHPTAPLWSGAATSFVVETNDPALPQDELVVTRRRGESFPVAHQIA